MFLPNERNGDKLEPLAKHTSRYQERPETANWCDLKHIEETDDTSTLEAAQRWENPDVAKLRVLTLLNGNCAALMT